MTSQTTTHPSWLAELVTTQDVADVVSWSVAARAELYRTKKQSGHNGDFNQAPVSIRSLLQTEPVSESMLESLEQQLKNPPTAKLYLTYQPHSGQLLELSRVIRRRLGNQHLVLDIEYHPELLGGCVLEYQGHRHDWSLLGAFTSTIARNQADKL